MEGGVEEVKQNIKRYGNIDICNFHVGYFNDTLPRVDKKVAFVFLDVDLRESLETCIKYFYPLLQDGCRIYTHEAHHMEFASLFFSDEWWQKNLGCTPPGLIGAGSGIGLSLLGGRSYFGSSLGYTIKNPQYFNFEKKPQKGC